MTDMTIVTNNAKTNNTETWSIFASSFIKALSINLPVALILAKNPILAVLGSTAGYSIRHYCNDFLNEHLDSNDSYQYLFKAAVCGGLGGSIKYGILSTSLDKTKLALGAINNFLYEATGPSKFCHKDDVLCHYAVSADIEGLEGLFANYIKLFNNEEISIAPILGGIRFGILLTTFSYLTGYSGSTTDDSYDPVISGDGINNTPYTLIEGSDSFTLVS